MTTETPPPSQPIRVGVFFGGVSPEHEVSVISALQAAAAMDRSRYEPVAVYIAKDGAWYTGPKLLDIAAYADLPALLRSATRVLIDPSSRGRLTLLRATRSRWWRNHPLVLDVAFLSLHGGAGENGSLQGVFEVLEVPYTGSGVLGSALGMDKAQSKRICREYGVPVVPYVEIREAAWAGQEEAWLDKCVRDVGLPAVVKPARLGSSIGISKAADRDRLDAAIEEAYRFDDKVVVEKAVVPLREVNCAVLGTPDDALASLLEQPSTLDAAGLLSFQDKYLRGGSGKGAGAVPTGGAVPAGKAAAGGMASLDRIIPAPLPDALSEAIRALAIRIFRLFECHGVARIDFLLDDEQDAVYFNEINTIPGSFAFYLWQPAGVDFPELVHRMIHIARVRAREATERVRTHDVNLLSERAAKGLKRARD